MSADNGVYILKTGNQYRVKHLFAIENLYWNEKHGCSMQTLQPNMIYEMFGDVPYTYSSDLALRIAKRIESKLPICEYGMVFIDSEMSWGQILKKMKEEQHESGY